MKKFSQDWLRFLKSQKNSSTQQIEENHEHEFSLLEAFSEKQSNRYRPYIESIDRYDRCRPYLENKISLSDGSEMSASLIKGLNQDHQEFIAIQAPLTQDISRFWQMIDEQQIDQIVMVTELAESQHAIRELAVTYWPQVINESLILENGIEVTLIEEAQLLSDLEENIQVRKFHLKTNNQTRVITHYWYRNWLDDTAPRHIKTIITLLDLVEEHKKSSKSAAPIVVHCSAGIGRTGVFITLYHLKHKTQSTNEAIKLFELIAYLRWQRPFAVATLTQYKFCHDMYKIFQESKN